MARITNKELLEAILNETISLDEAKLFYEMAGSPEAIANEIFAGISRERGTGHERDIWSGDIGGEPWAAWYQDEGNTAWLAYQGADDPLEDEYGMSATAYFSNKKQLIDWIKKIEQTGVQTEGLHGEL